MLVYIFFVCINPSLTLLTLSHCSGARSKPARARPVRPAPTVRTAEPRENNTTEDAGAATTRVLVAEVTAPVPVLDEWRDMSGDAITYVEAQERGVHAQCTLASVRNLRRNPDYSVRRLSERCIGAEYVDDIRYPDWPALILPVLREGEVVASGPSDEKAGAAGVAAGRKDNLS